jgi:hypothetical protein
VVKNNVLTGGSVLAPRYQNDGVSVAGGFLADAEERSGRRYWGANHGRSNDACKGAYPSVGGVPTPSDHFLLVALG